MQLHEENYTNPILLFLNMFTTKVQSIYKIKVQQAMKCQTFTCLLLCIFIPSYCNNLITYIYVFLAKDESIKRKFKGRILASLNGRYANAVDKIKNIIEQKGYEISKLVSNLNHIDTDNSTIFSNPNAASKITKIDEIFSYIGTHCNIYNYDLLRAFLISIDCREAIDTLDGFDKEVQNSVLKELDLLSEIGEPQVPMPGSHTLMIKYIGNKCTFETEALIRNVICECFDLKSWSVSFLGVQDGCITLVYQISLTVMSHLLQYNTTTNHATLLKKSHIKCIRIDNAVLKIPSRLIKRIIPSTINAAQFSFSIVSVFYYSESSDTNQSI